MTIKGRSAAASPISYGPSSDSSLSGFASSLFKIQLTRYCRPRTSRLITNKGLTDTEDQELFKINKIMVQKPVLQSRSRSEGPVPAPD